jgi:hypothetical protein
MRIKYYNRNLLFSNQKLLRELNIIKDDVTGEYINLYKDVNFYASILGSVFDRTDANEFFIPHVKHELPKNNNNKSFKKICEERSLELLNTGKRINILWSGGIDSTIVLWSLMNKANDLSQLRVIGTPDSIVESGNMFDVHIKNKIDYIIKPSKPSKRNFFDNKHDINKELFITGCFCDELNTTLRLTIPTDVKFHHLNYEDVLSPIINKELMDFLNKSIKVFPKEIKSYGDFLKFYHINYGIYKGLYCWLPELDSKYISLMSSFYETLEFQKWALWNKESDYTTIIKIPQRNYIYELTGDRLYSFEKGKSIGDPTIKKDNNWFFLLEENKTLTYNDLLNRK